jgi:hypothetical protein
MFTEDFDSLEMKISKSNHQRKQDKKNCQQKCYHPPKVYLLGSLEQIQLGNSGDNYDGSGRYWYYE